jgi:hypothetical protein
MLSADVSVRICAPFCRLLDLETVRSRRTHRRSPEHVIPAAVEEDARFEDSQMRFIDSIDTMVLGRVNYEMFAG